MSTPKSRIKPQPPTGPKSIDNFIKNPKPNPIEFFLAWGISPPVIAERLRIAGFPAEANSIREVLVNGIKTQTELYQLSIVMMEMRNDITKTFYSK
jgi:hypothetical protein